MPLKTLVSEKQATYHIDDLSETKAKVNEQDISVVPHGSDQLVVAALTK